MSKKDKKRWQLWVFDDWKLADQLRRAMNKKDHKDLVEVTKAPAAPWTRPKKRLKEIATATRQRKSLEALA